MRTKRSMILVWMLLASNACGGDDDDGTAIDAGGSGGQLSAGTGGKPADSGGSAAGGTGGGRAGSGGKSGTVATGGTGAGGGGAGGKGGAGGASALDGGAGHESGSDAAVAELDHFSFFVTSLEGMQRLADNPDGFGGDLTYGQADGLSGADKICEDLAEASMPGSAVKQWRAFLSAAHGPGGGGQVNAIERIGEGPWYDRRGRVVALSKADLLHERPQGADPAIADDLPNESGTPNMQPDPTEDPVDNHHVLTGSNEDGELYGATSACEDWTSTAPTSGRPRIGFSWSIDSRVHWISGQDEGGCGAGKVLGGNGGSNPDNPIVGSGGGYGAIYCFALAP